MQEHSTTQTAYGPFQALCKFIILQAQLESGRSGSDSSTSPFKRALFCSAKAVIGGQSAAVTRGGWAKVTFSIEAYVYVGCSTVQNAASTS